MQRWKKLGIAIAVVPLTMATYAAAATLFVPIEDPIPAPLATGSVSVHIDEVASGMASPVLATFAPDHEETLFVGDQTGKVWAVNVGERGGNTKTLFADLSSRLVPLGAFGIGYDERGLLGLAFHPDFEENGLLYTYTSEPEKGVADFSTILPGEAKPTAVPASATDLGGYHQSVVTEWRVINPNAKTLALNPTSAREVMRIDEPEFNHNGGALAFDKKGQLYIALGDGGQADDFARGHVAGGNAQSLAKGNVLGKILRIDPLGRTSSNGRYGVPRDNPKTGGEPEIFAYGFRNPYRMSFDKAGNLWTGDVGQNDIEEIDIVKSGANYGWPIKEGTYLFGNRSQCEPRGGEAKGCIYKSSPGVPSNLTDPVAQYDHTEDGGATEVRVAVIGGYLGNKKMGPLKGHYIFGDYSTEIGAPVAGHLFYLDDANEVKEAQIDQHPAGLGLAVLAFGQDAKGNIYLLANGSGTLADPGFAVSPGTSGKVLRLSVGRADRENGDGAEG